MRTILECKNVSITFGGLKAVNNFNIQLEEGDLAGLIGPNGAGKTTVFNLLTGVYTPTEGDILLKNYDRPEEFYNLNKKIPYQITKLGIARTFQNIRLFSDLTVLDNVRIARHLWVKYNPVEAILRMPEFNRNEKAVYEDSFKLLEIFNLDKKAFELAKNLPYGEQRKLEITRALATNPKLLLLDEPAAGMNPQETQDLMNLIGFVHEKFKLTILLIEHDMKLVMGICKRITVLDYGNVIANGTPSEISSNPDVIRAYLG